MSTTLETAPTTIKGRSVVATRHLCEALGLDDLTVLSVALAEAATDEARHNPAFVQRVKALYGEIAALKGRKKNASRGSTSTKATKKKLVPVGHVEGHVIDPHAPLDPHYLLRIYGADQLADALAEYTNATLKETAAQLESKYPGTKPKSKKTKADLVEYIVAQTV